jgi:hypothetical protein
MSARVGKGVAPAIVIAGALIAMGLYFGLRSRDGATPPASSKPAATSSAAPAHVSTERFAAAALEYHRPELVKRCWDSNRPAHGAPSQAKMTIDLTFGPDGSQVARGFREERGATRPEVTACVQRTLPPLRVPPPGGSVRVELPLTLP